MLSKINVKILQVGMIIFHLLPCHKVWSATVYSQITPSFQTSNPWNYQSTQYFHEHKKTGFYDWYFLDDPFFKGKVEKILSEIETRQKGVMKQNLTKMLLPKRFLEDLGMKLDFDFKYKGFKKRKEDIPPEINYIAMREEIEEGIVVEEKIKGLFHFRPNLDILGHIGFIEKWTFAKVADPLVEASLSRMPEDDLYKKTFLGTVVYGIGMKWETRFNEDRIIAIQTLFQQNASSEWLIRRYLLQDRSYGGIKFDLLELRINITF